MPTLIGSIPTTQSDDLELAKKILNGQENTSNQTYELEKKFKNIYENSDVYLFNRGREALYFVLKALGISENDEVLVQSMTCIAVVNPILWLNAKPVYVDINKEDFNVDIYDLEKKITSKTKVVIVQHTFGNVADVKKISEIAKRHDIYVIEDCAHLFLTDYSKTMINKYSDASFFSFAQDKGISCVQGGLATINNNQFKEVAANYYLEIGNQRNSEARYSARYIKLWSMIKKYYFTPVLPFQERVTLGKVMVMFFRTFGLIRRQASSEIEKNIHINRISNVQATLLLNQLKKCDTMNKHREEITKIYNENLNPEIINNTGTKYLLRYPILLKNPNTVMNILRVNKYICGRWYNSVVFPIHNNLEKVGYVAGSCPKTEILIKSILNLPTNIDLTKGEAIEIAKIVNKNGKPFKFSN